MSHAVATTLPLLTACGVSNLCLLAPRSSLGCDILRWTKITKERDLEKKKRSNSIAKHQLPSLSVSDGKHQLLLFSLLFIESSAIYHHHLLFPTRERTAKQRNTPAAPRRAPSPKSLPSTEHGHQRSGTIRHVVAGVALHAMMQSKEDSSFRARCPVTTWPYWRRNKHGGAREPLGPA